MRLSIIADEKYDKKFLVSVAIDGLTEEHKPVTVLHKNSVRNR